MCVIENIVCQRSAICEGINVLTNNRAIWSYENSQNPCNYIDRNNHPLITGISLLKHI